MNDGDEPLTCHGHCRPDGAIQRYLYSREDPGENIGMNLLLPLPPGKREGEGDHHAEDKHRVKHGHHDQDLSEGHLNEKCNINAGAKLQQAGLASQPASQFG
jgi:hypothetical protein